MWIFVGSICIYRARQRGRDVDRCMHAIHTCQQRRRVAAWVCPFILHFLLSDSDGMLEPFQSCCIFNGPHNNFSQKQPVIPPKCQLLQEPECFISFYSLYSPDLSCAPSVRQVINTGLCKNQQLFHHTHAKILLEIEGLKRGPGIPSLQTVSTLPHRLNAAREKQQNRCAA